MLPPRKVKKNHSEHEHIQSYHESEVNYFYEINNLPVWYATSKVFNAAGAGSTSSTRYIFKIELDTSAPLQHGQHHHKRKHKHSLVSFDKNKNNTRESSRSLKMRK